MKKLNQKGFTHHVVMFAILALVLGAMGFAGYRVWQNKNIDAKADNYSEIGSWRTGATLRACKVAVGSQWWIKVRADNPKGAKEKVSFGFSIHRPAKIGIKLISTASFGPLKAGTSKTRSPIKANIGDSYSVSVGNGGMGAAGQPTSMDSIRTGC